MPTKTTLRADARSRRRARHPRAEEATAPHPSPIATLDLAEAQGIARQVTTLASSMGAVKLPALFVPTPLEPDLSLTFTLFSRALLPVLVDEAGAPLGQPCWGLWEAGQALVQPGAVPAQPAGPLLSSEVIGKADLILVPALAVGSDGARLGQGGGWYDRTLRHRAPRALLAAVVHDDDVLAPGTIPLDPHDVPVDAVITPTRMITVTRP